MMSDKTLLPQPNATRQKSQEFLEVPQTVSQSEELLVIKADQKTENEKDLLTVRSKDNNNNKNININNKEEKVGLHFRISKFLARNRFAGVNMNNNYNNNKKSEDISIGSSKTAVATNDDNDNNNRSRGGGSSVSNESGISSIIDYSKQVNASNTSKLSKIGDRLKKLMKLKSQRGIKTEEEIIVIPNSIINEKNSVARVPITADDTPSVNSEDCNILQLANDPEQENKIEENENGISAASDTEMIAENLDTADINMNAESIVSVQSISENGATIIAENPHAVLVAAALTAQLGSQAEVQIQTSRRNPRDRDAPRIPFLYLQDEEPRVENYVRNMLGGERDSNNTTTGSESSSVTEVADANEQPEGRDAAEQYYNAVLRAVIRKQFRHLDDEPPIY